MIVEVAPSAVQSCVNQPATPELKTTMPPQRLARSVREQRESDLFYIYDEEIIEIYQPYILFI